MDWVRYNAPHLHLIRESLIYHRACLNGFCAKLTNKGSQGVTRFEQNEECGYDHSDVRMEMQDAIARSEDGKLDAKGYLRVVDLLILV